MAPGSDDVRILGRWQKANIKTVAIQQIDGVRGAPATGRIYVHRLVVEQMRALFAAWDEAGPGDRILTWEAASPRVTCAAVA